MQRLAPASRPSAYRTQVASSSLVAAILVVVVVFYWQLLDADASSVLQSVTAVVGLRAFCRRDLDCPEPSRDRAGLHSCVDREVPLYYDHCRVQPIDVPRSNDTHVARPSHQTGVHLFVQSSINSLCQRNVRSMWSSVETIRVSRSRIRVKRDLI